MENYIPKFTGYNSDLKKAKIALEKFCDISLSTVYKLHVPDKLRMPDGMNSIEALERWTDSREISRHEVIIIFAVSETLEIADQIWENDDWWVIDEEEIETQMISEGWNEND